MKNYEKIDKVLNFERDFNYDFFGFKTLERAYLLKVNGKIVKNTGRDCTLIQTRTITTENGTRTMQKEREYPLSTVFISLEHLAKAKSMEWVN